jgi:[ribosomal protein S18]-alanine N-acetyltransferase
METLTIAAMSEKDIGPVVDIEQVSFLKPWGALSFLSELSCENARSLILKTNGSAKGHRVVAYLCFRVMMDTIHILKIAVKPENRRQGIAYRFLTNCLDSYIRREINAAFLEVRQSNTAGMRLYQKLGFHIIGKRPGYYTDTWEDAILMQKNFERRF